MMSEKLKVKSEKSSRTWKMVNLGDVATFINGYPFKPTEWSSEGMEIIRIQNLTKGSSETNYFKGSVPEKYKIITTFFAVVAALALTGVLSAHAGGAEKTKATARVVFGGMIAMLVTFFIGYVFGVNL